MIFSRPPKILFWGFFYCKKTCGINYQIMKKILLIINYIFILLYLSGCGSYKTVTEQIEGISDYTLTIIISEFFPFEENTTGDEIKKQITESLNQRASLIIACYVSLNLSRDKISRENDAVLNNLINYTISGGKLIKSECSESNYCTATGEFNISSLKDALESMNGK